MRQLVFICLLVLVLQSCMQQRIAKCFPATNHSSACSGTQFFALAKSYNWQQRDSLAMEWFMQGHVPDFFLRFAPIRVMMKDSSGQAFRLTYWVSPDYFVVGNNEDWVRVPITPMAAQRLLDTVHAILPTRKMVDDIYMQSTVKLAPLPMFAFRDSSVTMYQHHLMIEGQRQQRKGLIAGIKKDVVTTSKLLTDKRANRVAIYGWHQPNGQPIQPVYTGHVNWYVDYSHGIRFVHATGKLNGKKVQLTNLLSNPQLAALLCNEDSCGYVRY
jgi:hypothetical protein